MSKKTRERWLESLCLENLEKIKKILKRDLIIIEKKIKEKNLKLKRRLIK